MLRGDMNEAWPGGQLALLNAPEPRGVIKPYWAKAAGWSALLADCCQEGWPFCGTGAWLRTFWSAERRPCCWFWGMSEI